LSLLAGMDDPPLGTRGDDLKIFRFKGFTGGALRGFNLRPPMRPVAVTSSDGGCAEVDGLAEKDKTTFSEPSERLRPWRAGSVDSPDDSSGFSEVVAAAR